jgi:hypothetical protein
LIFKREGRNDDNGEGVDNKENCIENVDRVWGGTERKLNCGEVERGSGGYGWMFSCLDGDSSFFPW